LPFSQYDHKINQVQITKIRKKHRHTYVTEKDFVAEWKCAEDNKNRWYVKTCKRTRTEQRNVSHFLLK